MRQTLWTATQTPPIVIVQGAYEKFCTPGTSQALYYGQEFDFVFPSSESIAIAAQETWLRFQSLVDTWRRERGATSSITQSVMSAAYQSIVGMGEVAVPFLLSTLASEGDDPDQWFWALKAITGADPVPEADRGNYAAMARAWLSWGRIHGYAR